MDKVKRREEIGIFALGGLGEVGKNCYVIDYLNQLFIVDAGILFPDDSVVGVDYIIPDWTYLKQNEEKIVGLFITHGHEDHIGGIPFLLKQIKIPKIFAAGVTVRLIENKMEEYPDLLSLTRLVEYQASSRFSFKDVEVSFIRLNHSIPDEFGICFKTPMGTVFHTGDFKFDLTPIGPKAEYEKLANLGEEGCLCMLSDSTNALRPGFTESEKAIGSSIKELFLQVKERIIVATFASNMFRVQQIIEACEAAGRKIVIFGRSMLKTIQVGQEVGYIKAAKGTIIVEEEIQQYKPSEICILCTGSQGEPMAALSRIAEGIHRSIKLMPGDTIIFSSNPIPGNQESVNRTINLLTKKGANVIVNSPITGLHTTGHGSQGELKLMLNLVKPNFFIPIHGEYRMQKVHANLAIETGVKEENIFILKNGDVMAISDKDHARFAGVVQAGNIYIDGSNIGDIDSSVMKERRRLSRDGMFALVITIDSKNKIVPLDIQVVSRGFLYMKKSEELTKDFVDYAKKYVENYLTNCKVFNSSVIEKELEENLGQYIREKTDRDPMLISIFMDVAQ